VTLLAEATEKYDFARPTKASLDDIHSKASDLKEEIDDEKDLFEKDKDFANWAKSHLARAEKSADIVARGRRGLAFLSGPVEAHAEAVKLRKEAKSQKLPADRQPYFEKAREKLQRCEKEAATAASDPLLAAAVFTINGKSQTPAQVASACRSELKTIPAPPPPAKPKAPPKKTNSAPRATKK
jgi:hypothetical protein